MATQNSTRGYARLQGALKNLGYGVARSTIARILKEHGIPPTRQRAMTRRTFARAHWPALLDFFTTDVSTIQSATHCAASVIQLHSTRVQGVPRSTRMNASACTDMFAFSRAALGLAGRAILTELGMRD